MNLPALKENRRITKTPGISKSQLCPVFLLGDELEFIGELRAKKIYGRAIGGNNFLLPTKNHMVRRALKAATDMPTVNNQRALPSG